MRNLQLIRTDYVTRIHFYIDTDTRCFTAFDVELLGEMVRLHGGTMEDLWHRVQSVIAGLRGSYNQNPVLPPAGAPRSMAFQVFDAYGAASRPEATFRSSGYLFLSRGILRRAGEEKAMHAQLMFDETDDRLGIILCGAPDELGGASGVREMISERSGAAVNLVPLLRYFGFPEAKAIGKRVLPVTFEKGLIVIDLQPLREVAKPKEEVKALPGPSAVEEFDDDIPF